MAFWTLGDVVKKLRERKGWTQEQLAEAAGVNTGTVVSLEAEGNRTKQETLQRVAEALGVSVSLIYQAAESVPEGISKQLLAAAAAQPPKVQTALAKLLQAKKKGTQPERH